MFLGGKKSRRQSQKRSVRKSCKSMKRKSCKRSKRCSWNRNKKGTRKHKAYCGIEITGTPLEMPPEHQCSECIRHKK